MKKKKKEFLINDSLTDLTRRLQKEKERSEKESNELKEKITTQDLQISALKEKAERLKGNSLEGKRCPLV